MTILELTDITGIGPATEEDLRDVGVETPEDLAEADLETLSEETGIGLERLTDFAKQAREATEAADAAEDEEAAAEPESEDVKVVLREGQGAASVKVGADWYEGLPIVTATADEDGPRKLQQVSEDAVLLQEERDTGAVRVGEVTYEDVPLFRRREKEGGVVEETHVQVAQVREKSEDQGLMDRVRGLLG